MRAAARAQEAEAATESCPIDCQDGESFIEFQLPVSKLSKECYKERKANAGQTLTALGSYWKGRKPLILVRAAVLGLLLPRTGNAERDRDIFLKLMLMDDDGLLKRKQRFDRNDVPRVMELLPEKSWSRAIELTDKGYAWKRGSTERDAVEIEAFARMGRDEKLRHCKRPEELPESALDDVWHEVNAHLGTSAHSMAELIVELGERRFGRRPRVGDPFCGGGSIPFEAARIGCDVYASDLNPIASLLTWGALNIVGGTAETRKRIAVAQKAIVAAVDAEMVRLGFEHDGGEGDLRLPIDAPTSWPHGWRVTRGEPVAPEAEPYTATCPRTGWRVPMISSRQVHERSRTILDLTAEPKKKSYRLVPRQGVDDAAWEVAVRGTVVRDGDDFLLIHDTGKDETRVRIANRAKAYLYCVEVLDDATGWRVPQAPSWIISRNYTTVARLVPDEKHMRFDIEVDTDADAAAFEAAAAGTVRDGTVVYTVEGREHTRSLEELRGDVQVLSKGAYDGPEGRERALTRLARCRNKYSETSGNNLRRWELEDVVPRPEDLFQERLYAVQWTRPDGSFLFTGARAEDIEREARVEALVKTRLAEWQAQGLVPDSRIDPGDKTDEPIRTRGWTHWHHLFTPRHLLIGALIRAEMKKATDPDITAGLALSFCPVVDRLSRLTQWRIGFAGSQDTAQAADAAEHVFYNQALNTFNNFGNRASSGLWRSLAPDLKSYPVGVSSIVSVRQASEVQEPSDIWITDPPYADAIHYHEITEYFIAWLAKAPPRRDWVWDSRRALAVRGEGQSFKRAMVDAFSTTARHMPDNGFQVVMFTHQDVGVWADLAEILWAAGLQVTAGWCIATETESATRVGSYVQGTVLLVLRKRNGHEAGFIARLQRPVELAVEEQLGSMRALDEGEDPNFGDADYQLAAYAAALKVLTRYASIDGRPVASEVLRERSPNEETEVVRLLRRARRLASDFLVPASFSRDLWAHLTPEERFYAKGLEMEKGGEARNAAYQEMARGFGVAHGPFLGSSGANKARLKTAKELGSRDLKRAGGKDKAETAQLEGFASSLVRHTLYGIHIARQEENLKVALDWFARNLPSYWQRQADVVALLDYLATIATNARADEAETARDLKGAVANHRP
jgi:adenine-specific DNA methylase